MKRSGKIEPPDRIPELPDSVRIEAFRERVWNHYRRHGRSFPWRSTRDPYAVLVSEIMLQQTGTERVLPYFNAFIERFPDFAALSAAPLAAVLALWKGLGYNRRAKALKDIASLVTADPGRFSADYEVLLRLPMVGEYTAAAVLVFAFDRPYIVLETNIRRAMIFEFFMDGEEVHDRRIKEVLDVTMERNSPREWFYALMDYGAALRKICPDINRKSRHYVRQPLFENSDRQLRGRILWELLENGPLSIVELSGRLPFADERIQRITNDLQAEGLLAAENESRYSIES